MTSKQDNPSYTTFYRLLDEAEKHLLRGQLSMLKGAGMHSGPPPPSSQRALALLLQVREEVRAWRRMRQELEIKKWGTFTCAACLKVTVAGWATQAGAPAIDTPFICRACERGVTNAHAE